MFATRIITVVSKGYYKTRAEIVIRSRRISQEDLKEPQRVRKTMTMMMMMMTTIMVKMMINNITVLLT